MNRIANRVHAVRDQRRLTRAELAGRIGVSPLTLRAIEAGLYTPSLSLAVRMARTLNHPVEDLFAV